MTLSRRSLLTLGGLSIAGLVTGACTTPAASTSQGSRTAAASTRPRADAPPYRPPATEGWQSRLVTVAGDGRLRYATDGPLRLPDFGHAGYLGGGEPLPSVPVVERIGPGRGDQTARLQAALDGVGGRSADRDGFRGALALEPGRYEVRGTLRLKSSGVVLRGAGDGADPATSTILHATGNTPANRAVIEVGAGGTWDGQRPGSRAEITSDLVPIGATTLEVEATAGLRVGDTVVVVHPCTKAWLDAIDGGGTGADPAWAVGSVPIMYNRKVTDIAAGEVTFDAPLFAVLDRSLSPCYLYAWARAGVVTRVGIESLRVDIEASGPQDEQHASDAIRLRNVEDGWVRDCTALHFSRAGVVTTTASRVTVSDCRAIEPASQVTGGRRYNFDAEARSQQVLFTGCHAEGGRHSFVSNGASTSSGIVFHRTTAEGSLAASEGHRLWTQGLLCDNHQEVAPRTDRVVFLGNRGDYGTSHGWSAVNSVLWAVDPAGKDLVVERPPTAQNWAVGCAGTVNGSGPFPAPAGHIEGNGRSGLQPASLHEAQLADRFR